MFFTNKTFMEYFLWNNKFATGVESIDNDHRKLIGMINELYTAMSKGEGRTVLHSVVCQMVDYSKLHFRREEQIMKQIDYPFFEKHEMMHDAFIARVVTFMQKLEEGKDSISIEIVAFLREWLSDHILKADMQLAAEASRHNLTH